MPQYRLIESATVILHWLCEKLTLLWAPYDLREHSMLFKVVLILNGKCSAGVLPQVVDDVLDFTGSALALGKPALNDLKSGLATAPVLFAAEVCCSHLGCIASVRSLARKYHHNVLFRRSCLQEGQCRTG